MGDSRHAGNRRPGQALLLGGLAASPATPAWAHHAMGGEAPRSLLDGLLSGLAHPVIGLDHLAFLIAAGVLAAGCRRGGALLPLGFVAASLAGTWLHLRGLALEPAAVAIAASLLVAGGLLLLRPAAARSARLVAPLFLLAGLVHGQAFAEGAIGAEPTPVIGYLAGLTLVQAAIAWGAFAVARRGMAAGPGAEPSLARWAGAAASVAGLVVLGTAVAGG